MQNTSKTFFNFSSVFFSICSSFFFSFYTFLESRYRSLCAACDNPASCYHSDKYYGRQGALLCLTDNIGDVAWVRLDDTINHFKVRERARARCPFVRSSRRSGYLIDERFRLSI